MKRFNWSRTVPLITVAGLVVFAACEDSQLLEVPQDEPLDPRLVVENDIVFTPSGAVFPLHEWNSFEDKSFWLKSFEEHKADMPTQPLATGDGDQPLFSVTGDPGPSVLCSSNRTLSCTIIPTAVPGASVTWWDAADYTAASVSDMAQFDVIYIHDFAGDDPGLTDAKAKYAAAVTGRVVISGAHFEHCGVGDANACRVLRESLEWIHAGTGTGLLAATQFVNDNWLPTTAPYSGIIYDGIGGGYEHVHITDPGHATMATSTDASLSNFGQSSHNYFSSIGSFTSVAEVCTTGFVLHPNDCPTPFAPYFLVTSVAVADQDGDGFPDHLDNCPTVANDQTDDNGNGVGDACESAPTVTISPSAVSVAPGGSVTFTTTATDSDDPLSSLTYEWRVDGIVQAGETGTSFTSTFSADATVRVTVRDPGLLSGFDEAQVTIVTNQPPVADAGDDQTLYRNTKAGVILDLDGS